MEENKYNNILITGIAGSLGRLLTYRLFRDHKLIGIARKPFYGKPSGLEFYETSYMKRKCENIFRTEQVDAVIHMGLMHNPRSSVREHHYHNVIGTMRLLEHIVKYKVKKFVLLSTANVYGPMPDNVINITEDAPLNGALEFPEMRDMIAVDMCTQSFFWRHPEVETVILRPVNILGPTVKNAASKYLRLRFIPKLMGFDPMVQLIHEMDVVEAMSLALTPGAKGVFNIVGPGAIPLSIITQELKKMTVPIPHFLVNPLYNFFWRWNFTNFPPQEWEYVKYSFIVDGTRAKEKLGYTPRYSLKETIMSIRG